jgi:hypothetical protein
LDGTLSQSLNPYAYALNNPISWVDPSGLRPVFIGFPVFGPLLVGIVFDLETWTIGLGVGVGTPLDNVWIGVGASFQGGITGEVLGGAQTMSGGAYAGVYGRYAFAGKRAGAWEVGAYAGVGIPIAKEMGLSIGIDASARIGQDERGSWSWGATGFVGARLGLGGGFNVGLGISGQIGSGGWYLGVGGSVGYEGEVSGSSAAMLFHAEANLGVGYESVSHEGGSYEGFSFRAGLSGSLRGHYHRSDGEDVATAGLPISGGYLNGPSRGGTARHYELYFLGWRLIGGGAGSRSADVDLVSGQSAPQGEGW